MDRNSERRGRAPGFTLIELAIALAVVAILAGTAWPSFADSMRRGRRADALDGTMRVMQAQERWHAGAGRYADRLDDLVQRQGLALGSGGLSPARHYSLAIAAADANAYTLTATAASSGQRADAGCTVMSVTVTRGNPAYAPVSCWSR